MNESDFNQVFSKRLRYYLAKYEMTQLELSKRLGVGTTSVSNWCKGLKSPRMDKVDAMCRIFNCRRSDLMEEPEIDSHNPTNSLRTLRPDESTLLDNYNLLNPTGKQKANDYVKDLTDNEKYTKDTGLSEDVAM